MVCTPKSESLSSCSFIFIIRTTRLFFFHILVVYGIPYAQFPDTPKYHIFGGIPREAIRGKMVGPIAFSWVPETQDHHEHEYLSWPTENKKHNTTYETVRRPLSHKICCPMLDAFYVFFYHGDLRSCGIMMDSVDRNAKNATAQWCLMIYFETESDYRHTFSQDQSQNGACRGNNFWFDILYRISKCCNPIIPSQHVTTIKNQHFPITHLEIAVRTVSTHSWLYLFFSDEYCWKQRLNYLCNDSRFAPTIPINRISPTTKYRMSHLCKIETNNLNYLEDHHTDKWWITTVIVR